MLEFMTHLTAGRPMAGRSELYRLAVSACGRREDPAEDKCEISLIGVLSPNDASITRSCAGKMSGHHGSTPEPWLGECRRSLRMPYIEADCCTARSC